jgi:hypothetical protein
MVTVSGPASLQRTGALTFPVARFVLEDGTPDGEVLATLGRTGWFRIFFGPGRRVELADGENWRIAATEEGPYIIPVVICDRGRLAAGSPQGDRTYVVHGRDFAYNFYPAPHFGSHAPTWTLREHERVLATFGTRTLHAAHPVPLAVALICFTLIKYGVPGDADLGIPEFRWA